MIVSALASSDIHHRFDGLLAWLPTNFCPSCIDQEVNPLGLT
jgi:hypothetical protein